MRPNKPAFTLLMVAAFLRIGFYPFQVVHAEGWGRSRTLTLAGAISPLLGIGLLYRLLLLPGGDYVFDWAVVWGGISVFWSGVKALSHSDRQALLPAAYALLLALVTGALVMRDPAMLLMTAASWVVCLAALAIARRYEPRGFMWSWPTIIALLVLLGVPPSPLLRLYHGTLATAAWGVRLLYLGGLTMSIAALVRGCAGKTTARVTPAYAYRWIPMLAGMLILVITIFAGSILTGVPSIEPMPFVLWILVVAAGCLLALWGDRVVVLWNRAHAVVELLDLGWLYRSVWQGANNMLGVLRVTAEVVEGSGSVLWSVLILLLVVMVGSRR
jgi:hypothetical protein